MSEFNEGDLVEATEDEDCHRGRVEARGDGLLGLGKRGYMLHWYEREGFTLTLIEKAAPALPTEPGWYRSSGLGADKVDGLLHRSDRGDWTWVGNMFAVNPDHLTDKQARQHLPLVRIEPVADAYARIAPQLEEVARCISRSDFINTSVSTVDIERGRSVLAEILTSIQAVTS